MSTVATPPAELTLAQIATLPAKGNIAGLRRIMAGKKTELTAILGEDVAARLCTALITETTKSEKLLECSIQSLVSCAVEASRLKLEIGGPIGQGYLVPYGGVAQFQVGYRGLITLAHRSGRVALVAAVLVREGDKFRVKQGTDRGIEHDPVEGSRKPVTNVYAVVQYRGGGLDFEVMSTALVNEHRDRFSKQKGPSSVWGQHWEQMALKTVLRRLLKRCPIGVDLGPDEVVADEPIRVETVDRDSLPPHQQEQLRQVESNEAEVKTETKPEAKTESVVDEEHFRLSIVTEVERLAVQTAGSWEAVRGEYAEGIKFTGTRAKDLDLDQALAFRKQLRLDLTAKQQQT